MKNKSVVSSEFVSKQGIIMRRVVEILNTGYAVKSYFDGCGIASVSVTHNGKLIFDAGFPGPKDRDNYAASFVSEIEEHGHPIY